MKNLLLLVTFFSFHAVFGLMVITNTANFVTGENTNLWQCSADRWISPAFPAQVATVSMTGTNLADGAAFNIACSDNGLNITATGGAKLTAATAVYTLNKLPAPEYFQVTNVIDRSFSASWQAVPGAVGYRLNFYSNVLEGVSAGKEVFGERFLNVPTKSGALKTTDEFDTQAAGWFFDTCYYSGTSQMIQIGNSSNDGYLALPVPEAIAGGGYTLEISASKMDESNVNRDMPISVVSTGNITNWLGSVSLANERAAFYLTLPPLAATDTIYFHSTTNVKDARVLLNSIRILDGYNPGTLRETLFGTVEVTGTTFATNGMPAVDGALSIIALSEVEDDSDESAHVDLPLANPPPMSILRALPFSLAGDSLVADFNGLSEITANNRPWYNGVSPLPYWMCYRDDGSIVTQIGVGTTNTTRSGLFKFHDLWHDYGEALGWRGNSERSFYTGIAFVNDNPRYSRHNFRLAFRPCQWNYRNEAPVTNTVEYLVTNELVSTAAPGDWRELEALKITPPYTFAENDDGAEVWWGGEMASDITGLVLGPGEYLIIRFVNHKASSSGGVGIDDFTLTSERKPLTSCIIFR